MLPKKGKILLAGVLFARTGGITAAPDADTQKQIDEIKGALPKFAIPMREVGVRVSAKQFVATNHLGDF